MAIIEVMADNDTTISVSKEFHDWLKGKGKKGESYEDLIKRLLKPESLQELGVYQEHSSILRKEYLKPKVMRKAIKDPPKSDVVLLESGIKPKQKAIKPQKSRLLETNEPKKAGVLKKPTIKPKISRTKKEPKQGENEKSLELQRLEIELELAKLSNDVPKTRELAILISKIKKEL